MKWLDNILRKSNMKPYLTYKYCLIIIILFLSLFYIIPGLMVILFGDA